MPRLFFRDAEGHGWMRDVMGRLRPDPGPGNDGFFEEGGRLALGVPRRQPSMRATEEPSPAVKHSRLTSPSRRGSHLFYPAKQARRSYGSSSSCGPVFEQAVEVAGDVAG